MGSDGPRFVYIITRRRPDAEAETLIESRDIEGRQQPTIILSSRGFKNLDTIGDMEWLPDGRLIYSSNRLRIREAHNLWALSVDPLTGDVRGKPERLTNWTGFTIESISATADGKRLVIIKRHRQKNIYIASLGTNDKSGLSNVQRLTTDTWDKHLNGWGSDSRAIYFCSNRNGRYGIYKQDIHQQAAESVVSGPEDYSNAQLSADGASLLYTATPIRGRLR